jgi:hypothetical protein
MWDFVSEVKERYQCHIQNFEKCISEYYIVSCFLGNATRNCVGVGFGWICLLDNHSLHSLIQIFALITPLDLSSSTVTRVPLTSVQRLGSPFFQAGLTPALVGYELTGSSEFFLAYILRSDWIELEYLSSVAAGIQQFCLCWVGSFLGSMRSHGPLRSDGCPVVRLSGSTSQYVYIPSCIWNS